MKQLPAALAIAGLCFVFTPTPSAAGDGPTPDDNLAQDDVTCSYDAYNCSDFTTCSQAMKVHRACSGDPHGLDGDSDGTPCESLCG